MGNWQPRPGGHPQNGLQLRPGLRWWAVLGSVPPQPVTWRLDRNHHNLTNQSLPPRRHIHQQTDKSSSRWSPKSRLDGNDAPSFAMEPRTKPTTTNNLGPAFLRSLYHHIYYIYLIYIHFREARSRYQPSPFGFFSNIFGSRHGGRNMNFLVFFSHVPLQQHSIHGVYFLPKKEGRMPVDDTPEGRKRGETPFLMREWEFHFLGGMGDG